MPIFGLSRKYHGAEKTALEKIERYSFRGLKTIGRGRTPCLGQSFRNCPRFFCCRFRARKGSFDAACGHLPSSRARRAQTRQIALPLTIRRMRRLRRRSRLRRPIFWNCCRCRNWNGNRNRTGTMTRRNDGLTTCRICLCPCS